MKILDKLHTGSWLITKGGKPLTRLRLYRNFQRENREWQAGFDWKNRIRDAVACPDNAFIPRVENAGRILDGQLVMHNGLRVGELSYDGEGPRSLMVANCGVHEPQEERVFQEVLKVLPAGSVMLELGSYWAFYSMWFHREVQNASCYCLEPDLSNIQMGKDNFVLNFGGNAPRVHFDHAYVGVKDAIAPDKTPILSVDGILRRHRIERLAILHADTQGHELNVLLGATEALDQRRVDYIFLSTHTNELHRKCLAVLRKQHYVILADIDLLETYSFDGLIVARRRELAGPGPFDLSRKA